MKFNHLLYFLTLFIFANVKFGESTTLTPDSNSTTGSNSTTIVGTTSLRTTTLDLTSKKTSVSNSSNSTSSAALGNQLDVKGSFMAIIPLSLFLSVILGLGIL